MRRRGSAVGIRLAAVAAATAAAVAVLAPAGTRAAGQGTATFTAVADTFVRADRPRTSYGRSPTLVVGKRPQTTALIRFDVVVPDGASVARATLELTPVTGSAAPLAVHRVRRAAWSERTTFATAPAIAPRPVVTSAPTTGTVSLDVTPLVTRTGRVDVALRAASRRQVVLRSRDATSGAPRLVVETTGGDTSAAPCGTLAAPRTIEHVIWIWMENKPYDAVIGSPSAPFTNELAQGCGLATDYRGVAHPSLPNYIAATSGSTHGISDDDNPAAHPLAGPSIYSQVKESGRTWRDYGEGSPGPCPSFSTGRYLVRHDPATYYTAIRADCLSWAIPMGTTDGGSFAADLAAGTLPAFALVTPDACHDTHDCPVSVGDDWLRGWFAKILASPAYRSGRTAVFVVWDEDDNSSGNHVPLIAVSPSVKPGTRLGGSLDHYALLKTTEQLLGISTLLGHAGDAGTGSMVAGFNLG